MWVTNATAAVLSIITGGGQVGRDQDTSRFALPAPPFDGGKEILALRGKWGTPSPLENAKTELKALMPEDAKEAIGHGLRAKRSKSGAVSFDVLSSDCHHAPVQ